MLTRCLPFGGRAPNSPMSSVRGPQVSHREFNLTVGKLPPVLDDRREVSLRKLIEDFAGFATSFLNWQLEYLRRLHGGHPGCQILRANAHVRPPEVRKRGLLQIVPILGVGA
jgi:hypothetical protein